MFNKVFEDKFNDEFIKGYRLSQQYTTLDIVKFFQDAGILIKNIHVSENADLGMKNIQGNYSLDDFLNKYNLIKKNIDSIMLSLDGNNQVYVSNDNYVSLMSKNNIEIENLFERVKKY